MAENVLPGLTGLLQSANQWMQSGNAAKVADDIGNAFKVMGDAIKWTKDNSYWLIPAVAGVTGSLTALKIITTITGLYRTWRTTTFAVTLAQRGLNAALRANPIGLWVTGIGLAIAAGVALWKNWDKIEQKAYVLWSKVSYYWAKITGKGPVTGTNLPQKENAGPATLADLHQFAAGGIAYQASIFGEAGPEMAIPLQKTPRALSLLQQTERILGVKHDAPTILINSNFSPTITINGAGSVDSSINSQMQKYASDLEQLFEDLAERYFGNKARVSFG